MSIQNTLATEVALPAQSAVSRLYPSPYLADAFAIMLPPQASSDPEILARFIFAHQPAWIKRLTRVRDLIVAGFGLKTSAQMAKGGGEARAGRVGIFKIYGTSADEIVLGEDDSHLDFRVSVLCADAQGGTRMLTVSTVVHCHNLLGRIYIRAIGPIHRVVVKSSLRRAARIGWPLRS